MPREKKSATIRGLLIVAAAIALVATALVVARGKGPAKSSAETQHRMIRETVTNIIEVSGTIEAAKTQTLTAAGDGTVTAVYVAVGDRVKKGDVLMELDKADQEYDLAKHDFDTAQKKISGSPKELELMAYQRKALEQKLEDRNVIANFDGVVADFTAAVGDYLEAKDTVGTLIQRDYLKAYVEVVETDAPKLKAGQKVFCTFPAYTEGIIEGEVVSYPAVGSITNRGASIVKVEIRIPNPPEIILPNYSFTGEIEISPAETISLIPREALGTDSQSQTYVEQVLEDGASRRVRVVAEPYDRSYFKVLQVIDGELPPGAALRGLAAPAISGTRPGDFQAGSSQGQQGGGFGGSMPGMGGAGSRPGGGGFGGTGGAGGR